MPRRAELAGFLQIRKFKWKPEGYSYGQQSSFLPLVRGAPKEDDFLRGGNGLEQGYSDVTETVNLFDAGEVQNEPILRRCPRLRPTLCRGCSLHHRSGTGKHQARSEQDYQL